MKREIFKRTKKNIIFYETAFGLLCEAVSLLVIGFDGAFACGIALGIITITVNLILLENVIDIFICSKKTWLAFPVHTGRLLLFAASAVLCLYIDLTALIGYAAGIICFAAGVGTVYIKEGRIG